jgi:hypothetical protein
MALANNLGGSEAVRERAKAALEGMHYLRWVRCPRALWI